ncbi:MAG: ribosomal L7Ae/L30e/S12e/Gadd45 family protein [Bacilli bacterium]|jgi:ribosomal protein L7Ae-like RNA K-turn-binding protein|nr:ribosomal L7Ae/L30e/S12e/Gadd45 family protein [Bacilli bacterium]
MSKLLSCLGLAHKAGKIIYGERTIEMIQKQQAQLVIITNDASANTKKRIKDKCAFYHVKCYEILNSNDLFQATHKVNRMYCAIIDNNFKKLIETKIEEEYNG